MSIQKIQQITLRVFFPAMFLCASVALISIWLEPFIDDSFYRLIPTFLIIGLAAWIPWAISMIVEFRNIAKARK